MVRMRVCRDYKQWAMGPGSEGQKGEVINVGIASMGLPLTEVAGKDPNLLPALQAFLAAHNLHLLVLMTLYTAPPATKFKVGLGGLGFCGARNLCGLGRWGAARIGTFFGPGFSYQWPGLSSPGG